MELRDMRRLLRWWWAKSTKRTPVIIAEQEFQRPKTSAPAVAHLGERLCSVVDAAHCFGQALSRGES